jgi:hypothetical protein
MSLLDLLRRLTRSEPSVTKASTTPLARACWGGSHTRLSSKPQCDVDGSTMIFDERWRASRESE